MGLFLLVFYYQNLNILIVIKQCYYSVCNQDDSVIIHQNFQNPLQRFSLIIWLFQSRISKIVQYCDWFQNMYYKVHRIHKY